MASHSAKLLSRSREISIKLNKINSRSTDFLSRSRHLDSSSTKCPHFQQISFQAQEITYVTFNETFFSFSSFVPLQPQILSSCFNNSTFQGQDTNNVTLNVAKSQHQQLEYVVNNPNTLSTTFKNTLSTIAPTTVNKVGNPQCNMCKRLRILFMKYASRVSSRQKSKMATNMAETSTTDWDNFFEELVRLLTDYEALFNSADSILQENVFIRMESALLALQQVIPSAIERGLNCASVLQEIFTNFRILFLEWTR